MSQDHATALEADAPTSPAGRSLAFGAWYRSARDWIIANRTDIAIVGAITLFAALIRIWDLGTVPLGLHGDEAWTGLDARRINDEGSIGPYVGSALGQPTGPLYFTALLFRILPETTATIRFSMAFWAILTIPMAYLCFTTMFNRTVGAIACVLLAVMMWHLHLSRTGFMVATWPFAEMLTLWLLWLAFRQRNIWLFLAAGTAHGLGVYTYNAYLLFVPVPFVGIAWMLAQQRSRERLVAFAGLALVFAAAALLFAMPMIRYISNNTDEWRGHQKTVNLADSDRWEEADGIGEKFELLWDRGREWQKGLIYGDRVDRGDGLATENHPPLDPIIFVLALGGIGVALFNIRKPEYAVVLAATVILPWGALLTIDDGLFRRTLGIAPFFAVLAALPLAWLWEKAPRFRRQETYLIWGAVLLVPLFIGTKVTYQYFGPVQDDPDMRYVFPRQLDAASHYMDGLPRDTVIYFYSGRWGYNYETRRFLAPETFGVDRSLEFRPEQGDAPLDLSREGGGPVAFVLLDPYLQQLEAIQQQHPGGVVVEEVTDGETLFRAYFLAE